MLGGRDVLAPALRLISARTGRAVAYAPAGQEPAPEATPVVWRGRILGHLSSAGAGQGDLAAEAQWLAGWIVLAGQHAQLREAAFTDPLTGAWNRRYFDRILGTALDKARE